MIPLMSQYDEKSWQVPENGRSSGIPDCVDLLTDGAVRQTAFLQILLVIVFGAIEIRCRCDLGYDFVLEAALRLFLRGPGSGLLLWRVEENRRAVLSADVRPLTVHRGWVVIVPEYV